MNKPRKFPTLWLFLVLTIAFCGACEPTGDDDSNDHPADDDQIADNDDQTPASLVEFTNGHVTLLVDREQGTFDVQFDGYTYLRQATSAIEVGTGGLLFPKNHVFTPNDELQGLLQVESHATAEGTVIELHYPPTKHGQITTFLTLEPNQGGLRAEMIFEAVAVDDLVSLIPIYIGRETGGGLFMRSNPSGVQILQDGSEMAFDFYVDLQYGDYPYSRGLLHQYLTSEPSSSSNWNALLYDRAHQEGLNMGYLSFETVIPEIILGFEKDLNPIVDGRVGWFTFQTRNSYILARSEPAGFRRYSELFWIDRFTGRPQKALEAYAHKVADHLQINLDHPPRAGWDSWYIYSDNINQQLIEENLAGIVANFVDYGMNSMEIDLGWQDVWGDWRSDPERFPDGLPYLVQRIKDAGLQPEVWIAPFSASRRSDILQEHPEWTNRIYPLSLLLLQPNVVPLDLTRQEVVDFVGQTGSRLADDYGFDAVKFDFGYYEYFLTQTADPTLTLVEAYRRGLTAFRDQFGWDKNFINILLNGINYGLIDAMRIGIDSWPCWGDDPRERCPYFSGTTGYDGSGIRIVLKALARRYYLNNVVWVNFADQIFFRNQKLGLIPHRSWATVIALSGGIMSLGEEIASMSEEAVETYRRLLPNLGLTGVPWDLFDREYPEIWLTPLTAKDPGGYVLHLYSWGDNWDRTVNPPTVIPEGSRQHTITLADLELTGPFHAFEFWTQTDLGIIQDRLEIEVPARDCRVIILRPVEDHPYLLASNRHASQGGTDLHDPLWNSSTQTLTWTQDLVLGFPHTVYIDPATWSGTPVVQATGNAETSVRRFGALWAVDIDPGDTGSLSMMLSFGAE